MVDWLNKSAFALTTVPLEYVTGPDFVRSIVSIVRDKSSRHDSFIVCRDDQLCEQCVTSVTARPTKRRAIFERARRPTLSFMSRICG